MKLLKLFLIASVTLFLTVNYAEAQTASVEGVVYEDANSDGVAGPGETVVEGTTVTLINAETGEEIATVVTGEDGSFSFEGLSAGEFAVRFTYPSGLTVQSAPFPLNEGQSFGFNAPVVTATQGGATTNPNLSVVNPAATRGDDVSAFTP
jgi:hypothetical protein